MNGLSSLILLFFLIGLLIFTFFYWQAKNTAKKYQVKKRKFGLLSGRLVKFKGNIELESERWPIYARPVMFTEADHHAQIEFAKAQRALTGADELVPIVRTLPEPPTPEQFSLHHVLDIPRNLSTIFIGMQFDGNVNALEQELQNIRSSLRLLRVNRQEIERTRLAIEKSVAELKRRIEHVNKRLKPLDVWKSIEAHNLTWAISTAERCQSEAQNGIVGIADAEQGYIEHAIADIFVKIANFLLDCIELFLESQKISRRYQLDDFLKLFNNATGFLKSILEMGDVWSGWKKLKKIKPYIDALPNATKRSQDSLRSFIHRKQHLEFLIGLISDIDIQAEIKYAAALERECVSYWYSYTQRKTYWEKALGSPVQLPTTGLNHFQTLLIGEIHPEIDIDMVIKQSAIFRLMTKIGLALEWHDFILSLVTQLEVELSRHKRAQELVNELLDENGQATLILAKLEEALLDTSPDINDSGAILANNYEIYSGKAKAIQGADFPELVDSITKFISDADYLIRAHQIQLTELSTSYDAYYERIELLNQDVEIYINHIPKFDSQSVKLFRSIFEESSIILSLKKVGKYSWLQPVVDRMQAWIDKTESFIAPARNKYDAFNFGKRQVEKSLQQSKEEISIKKADVESRWGWYKRELKPIIDSVDRQLNREKKAWDRIIQMNWAEYNISRAISTCQNLIKYCEDLLFELNKSIGKINQKQSQLEGRVDAISLLLKKNSSRLPQQDQRDIDALIIIARQSPDYELANRVLSNAHTLALRKANTQMRNEITHIINVYSRGGPVFMDQVDNRGIINGAVKTAQQKKLRRTRRS